MSAAPKFTKPGADVRREQILAAALSLAENTSVGFERITRDGVAQAAGVSAGTVNVYFRDMPTLRSELMRYAVSKANIRVVAQGLLAKHPEALRAPQALRSLAAGSVFDA